MQPKKILAIKFRSLGDTVLLLASLRALKEKYPLSEIHVAVTAQWAPILQGQKGVDRIWPFSRPRDAASRAKTLTRLGLKLRKEKFDWVVNFHASPSSALLAFSTGSKTRSVHFHGHKDKNRFSTVTIPNKGKVRPNIERDLDCLRALGLEIPEGVMPKLHVSDSHLHMEKTRLDNEDIKNPILALGIGASRSTKIWPIERFCEIAKKWEEKTKGSVLLITSETETELKDQFVEGFNGSTFHAHQLPFPRLAASIAQCKAYFGNDSGPKHMAVALGIPTITVIGPEDPFEWHPYSKQNHPYLFIPGLDCRKDALPGFPEWCGLSTCVEKKHQCMMKIDVNQVWEKIQERAL